MNSSALIELVRRSGLVEADALTAWADRCEQYTDARSIASMMIDARLLTAWQAELLLKGKWKGFFVDSYCLLDLLESDDTRGVNVLIAVDRATGSRVILEVAYPSRARTKDDRLFYRVQTES